MGKIIDLTGQKFGRLTVLSLQPEPPRQGKSSRWVCLCECGQIKLTTSYSLRSGACRSCGCLHDELTKERFTTRTASMELQRRFGTVMRAGQAASVSGEFLVKVVAGQMKCNTTYHRVKRHVLGDATPDGRRRRMVNCQGCNTAFLMSTVRINRGEAPACENCREFVAKGGRAKPLPLPALMDAPKPKKERRQNRETAEITRIVKEQL